MSAPKVRISKPLHQHWTIRCDACAGDGFTGAFFPWATAQDFATAVVVARLHVKLHEDDQCRTCSHIPPLPNPKVLERGMFRIGAKVYSLRPDGAQEVAA